MKYIALGILAAATGALVLSLATRPTTPTGAAAAGAGSDPSGDATERADEPAGDQRAFARHRPAFRPSVGAPGRTGPAPEPGSDPGTSVRAGIQREIATAVAALDDADDVDRYLEGLTERAERNRQVSALEVEPGLAAIASLLGELGPDEVHARQIAFAQRMETLSARLDGRLDAPPAPASPGELSR